MSRNPYFVYGPAVERLGVSQVGGKALSLAKTQQCGFETPPFSVITTDTFVQMLRPFEGELSALLVNFNSDKVEAKHVEQRMKEIFETVELPPEVIQNFQIWATELKIQNSYFAVRSSVVDEDGENFSFAGQMESHLYQKNIVDIESSIHKVMASAFSERSLIYRKKNKLETTKIQCAVVIQKMLRPEASGVLFTRNPKSGSSQEYHISAAFGVGEGIVSGHSDCDEWTYDWRTGRFESTIGNKQQMVISAESGPGTQTCTVPKNMQMAPCLGEQQLQDLLKKAKALRDNYNFDLDIEWAFEGGKLYFLQARAITSHQKSHQNLDVMVFDNSNIQESFCGITLPLTFSFASEAYFYVYTQLMKEMRFSEYEIRLHEERHRKMLAYVHGRVFYNIESWYLGLKFLPSFGKNKSDMERMMGVEYPVDFVHDLELTPRQKLKVLPQLLGIAARLGYKFSTIDKLKMKFSTWFSRSYANFENKNLKSMSDRELVNLIQVAKLHFLENWGIPLVNDFFVMTNNGRVYRTLEKIGLKQEGPKLLFGEKLESTEPTKRIIKLCEEIKSNQHVLSLIKGSMNGQDFFRDLKHVSPEIHSHVRRYIYDYGDRVAGELKLESKTLHQDPQFLFEILRSYLDSGIPALADFEKQELKQRELAEMTVFKAIKSKLGSLQLILFKSQLRRLRKGIVYRESMRMDRTRVFGLFRKFYLEVGQKWSERGILETPRDIFYLTEREISDLVCARSVILDVKKQIQLRKNDLENVLQQEPPSHFSAVAPIGAQSAFRVPFKNNIQNEGMRGLGCFPGIVTGQVAVVLSPDDVHPREIEDKILVAMRTDPGWAPLFLNLKGLIVEKGSSLSHSAIVARELQIPTIVGVSNITKLLKSGDFIKFNGETGEIERSTSSDLAQSYTEVGRH